MFSFVLFFFFILFFKTLFVGIPRRGNFPLLFYMTFHFFASEKSKVFCTSVKGRLSIDRFSWPDFKVHLCQTAKLSMMNCRERTNLKKKMLITRL